MRKTVSIFLLFLSLLLAACGGEGTSAPVSSQITPTSPQTTPMQSPIPTSSQATPTSSQKHRVHVTLQEFKIISSVRTFKPGITYHFIVTNQGNIDHELMIVPTGLDVESMTMGDLHKMVLLIIDDIAPGQSQTIDYTFPSSALGEHYEMACHFRGHYQAGMRLSIKVTK